MRRTTFIIFFLTANFLACSKKEAITIRGNVPGINASKVYLIKIPYFNQFIDSADYVGDRFEFLVKDYDPTALHTIAYLDENQKVRTLLFRRGQKNTELEHMGTNAFYLEPEEIVIEGTWDSRAGINKAPTLGFIAGAQNKYFMDNMGQDVLPIDNSSQAEYRNCISRINEIIENNSTSYYLLSQLNNSRARIKEKDLLDLLNSFDANLRSSAIGISIKSFANNRNENAAQKNRVAKSLNLRKKNGEISFDVNKNKKVNMLVFWASWCYPCRLEIPALKKLSEDVDHPEFYLASISVDRDEEEWQKAIVDEGMLWDQYIVEKEDLVKVKSQFQFSAIPLIVITDKSGKILEKITGYKEDSFPRYIQIIDSLLVL